MCIIPGLDPFSMILMGVGTAVQAAGAIASGQQQAALAEAQAKAYEQQAAAEQLAAGYEATREFERQQKIQAQGRAAIASSGVGFAGSPTEALVGNAGQGQLDIQAIQWGSQIRQNNLGTQAGISRMQGSAAKQAGFINAASGLIGGISNMYDRSVQMGGPSPLLR